MTELTCQQCQQLAAELALDVLPCHERARALAHLDYCTACQDTVSTLTVTADRLVELLPAAEPPAGFEQRVINVLTPPSPRARRRWIPVAAGPLAIALTIGGWILGHSNHNVTPTQTNTQAENDAPAGERAVMYAPLTTAQGQIGHAYVYPGDPSWIYLSLDTNGVTASDTVHLEVVHRNGSTVQVGTFPLTHGHGAWGGPVAVDRDTLATARLTDGRGATLATARFASPAQKSGGPPRRSHVEHRRPNHPQ